MGPIGSKVIEVKGQIYGFFFCWSCFFLFVPLLLPGPWADPDISSSDSFIKGQAIEVKGQISISQQSLVRFT